MKRKKPILAAAAALAGLLFAAAIRIAAGAPPPAGVVEFDTSPAKGATVRTDKGFPTTAAAVHGDSIFLGRDGGIRKYDRLTGKWEFFRYDGTICPGHGTVGVTAQPPYLWARLTNTGRLCRFDPRGASWHSMTDWKTLAHTGPGERMFFRDDFMYVAGQGSPDWEGVNIIDRNSEQWIKLLPTKPISAMYVDSRFIWLGVPAGILRINRVTEDYTYFQPAEHGGGAIINDILPIPSGIAFATVGNQFATLGDEIKLSKNSFQVYNKSQNRWYSYKNSDRQKLIEDLHGGNISTKYIQTHPGLLILSGGKWRLIDSRNGLDADGVTSIDKDQNYLYVATVKGLSVLDLGALKPKDVNPHIRLALLRPLRVISDREYLWVITSRGLFRVTKKNLFSFPR